MVSPAVGAVVLVRFPFSDLSGTKLRPAIVLAAVQPHDWVLCQVTSNPYADPLALKIDDADLRRGSLRRVSFARPGKLFTADASLMAATVAELELTILSDLLARVAGLFRKQS